MHVYVCAQRISVFFTLYTDICKRIRYVVPPAVDLALTLKLILFATLLA